MTRTAVPDIVQHEEAGTLIAAGNGDHVAFDRLYNMFSARIFGTALAMIRDRGLAEDVTHDVFMEIWRKAPQFDPTKGPAAPWILRLARSRAVDRIRSTELSRTRTSNWATQQHEPSQDVVVESVFAGFDQEIIGETITEAITTLTPVQREAILLAYFEGQTCSQIGQTLNTPVSTIKTRIRDGLIKLREHMIATDPRTTATS